MKQTTNALIAFIIFIFGIVIFTAVLVRGFSPGEAKLALYTQWMLRHGWSWFPQAYQGLSGFNFSTVVSLAYISSLSIGRLTVFTAAIPCAVASGVTLAFTYLIGSLRSKSWGLIAVLFVFATEAFFLTSRSLSFAPFITAITTMSLFLVIVFESRNFWLYSALTLMFSLGYIFEGMIGLLLPAIMVWVYLLWRLKFKTCFYTVVWAIIMMFIWFMLMIWAASAQGSSVFVRHVIDGQLETFVPKANWAWAASDWFDLLFYIISLPAAILVIITRWHNILLPGAKWVMQFIRAMITWAIVMIVITIFWGWRPNFMLPITPALALISAYIFAGHYEGVFTRYMRKFFLFVFALVPFAGLVVTIVAFAVNHFKGNAYTPFYMHSLILLVLLCILAIFFGAKRKETLEQRSVAISLIAAVTYLVINIGVVEQIYAHDMKAPSLGKKVAEVLKQHPADLVFYGIQSGNEDMLFMVNLNVAQQPIFVEKPQALLDYSKPAYFVAKQKTYDAFPANIKQQTNVVEKGQVYKTPVVIFDLKIHQPGAVPVKKVAESVGEKQVSAAATIVKPAVVSEPKKSEQTVVAPSKAAEKTSPAMAAAEKI